MIINYSLIPVTFSVEVAHRMDPEGGGRHIFEGQQANRWAVAGIERTLLTDNSWFVHARITNQDQP